MGIQVIEDIPPVVEYIEPAVPAKAFVKGESEVGLYSRHRRSTEECQNDVFETPNTTRRTPGGGRVFGGSTSTSSLNSDSELVWYGNHNDEQGEILNSSHNTPFAV